MSPWDLATFQTPSQRGADFLSVMNVAAVMPATITFQTPSQRGADFLTRDLLAALLGQRSVSNPFTAGR